MNNRIVISGCSGGGKSTLVAELARRGYAVVEEPGRRIVKEELERGSHALPWIDPAAFLRRAIEMAHRDWSAAGLLAGPVFFDRGLVDAASALEHLLGEPLSVKLDLSSRYHRCVFLAPPWPEIYETDTERQHELCQAIEEYERLSETYPSLGYKVHLLPRTEVSKRADFLLSCL